MDRNEKLQLILNAYNLEDNMTSEEAIKQINELFLPELFLPEVSLSAQQKCEAVSDAPEVLSCVKLLCALFKDAELKNFVLYNYEIEGEMYQLIFRKLHI